jgi:hypothetical protein
MDGQGGPIAAPPDRTAQTNIDANATSHFAFYYTGDPSRMKVLAPKDWHCLGLYGSSGSMLFITPTQLLPEQFFGMNPLKGIIGPAIQYSMTIGDTSGRFEAAKIIARVFPQDKKFVDDVIAEKLAPASDFPFGPYPADRVTRRGPSVVEYATPAGAQGLGLVSRLLPGQMPIAGTVILLDQDHDILHLAIRLPQGMRDLSSAIISQTEADNPGMR